VALLVQFLGTVIGVFSSRYLQGEPGQGRYMARLAGVLAGVHVLLLADHWLLLIAAWAWVGHALRPVASTLTGPLPSSQPTRSG
jgi:NAD(P)H-quinone oxidoreductase subunit 5